MFYRLIEALKEFASFLGLNFRYLILGGHVLLSAFNGPGAGWGIVAKVHDS